MSSVIDAYGRVIGRVDMFDAEASGNFVAVQPVIGDSLGNLMLVLAAGLVLGF